MGAPQGLTLNEELHAFTFLISEDDDGVSGLSRDQVLIGANQTLYPGQVLGSTVATTTTASASATTGNVGNGTLTLASPAVSSAVRGGNYRVVFNDATHFVVQAPAEEIIGEGVVGTAWTKEVLFTIAAGGTAFAEGDSFVVNVDEVLGEETYVAWNPTATDGSQRDKAVLCYRAITTNGYAAEATVINGHAQVRYADLTWATGATQAQIDEAMRDMAKNLIKFR